MNGFFQCVHFLCMTMAILSFVNSCATVDEPVEWGQWNTDTEISFEQPATTNHRLRGE